MEHQVGDRVYSRLTDKFYIIEAIFFDDDGDPFLVCKEERLGYHMSFTKLNQLEPAGLSDNEYFGWALAILAVGEDVENYTTEEAMNFTIAVLEYLGGAK